MSLLAKIRTPPIGNSNDHSLEKKNEHGDGKLKISLLEKNKNKTAFHPLDYPPLGN